MAIPPGSYKLGPENGKMLVKTGREGMGGKMGHDLVIAVALALYAGTVLHG